MPLKFINVTGVPSSWRDQTGCVMPWELPCKWQRNWNFISLLTVPDLFPSMQTCFFLCISIFTRITCHFLLKYVRTLSFTAIFSPYSHSFSARSSHSEVWDYAQFLSFLLTSRTDLLCICHFLLWDISWSPLSVLNDLLLQLVPDNCLGWASCFPNF